MRILIIGDCNSIHVLNFIRVVLEDMVNADIILFDMSAQYVLNKEVYDYCKERNIKIIQNNGLEQLVKFNIIRKIPKLRVLVHIALLNAKIRKLGNFDYCLLHYVDIIKAKIVISNKDKYQNIIPVFWGSDLLRNKRIESTYYRRLFQQAYKIVFNTENMRRVFETIYFNEFATKTEVIKFPVTAFEKIDHLKIIYDADTLKSNLGLPKDRYIVICGHVGTKEEQYEKLIETVSICKDEVKEKCYFVFLMTYGCMNLQAYQNKIKEEIKKFALDGMVLCDYMEHDEMLKLFICSDIYITTITTDAFSGVMQENLYSGAMLIYGKWLNYFEFEDSGIIAQPVENVIDVADALQEIVTNYDKTKPQLNRNSRLISSISSPQSIYEMWQKKVFFN